MSTGLIIYLCIVLTFGNTACAFGLKDLRITKTQFKRWLALIPPVAFLWTLIWVFAGIFKSIPNYFKDTN